MKIKINAKNSNEVKICFSVDSVFDFVLRITNDIELAMDVQGWSDLAEIGEVYDTDYFVAVCE